MTALSAPWRRRLAWALAALVLLLLLAFLLQQMAARLLRDRILAALGPEAQLASVRIDLQAVVIEGLRLPAPAGWPAPDALRAERVRVVPDLRTLFSGQYRISSIEIDGAYLSALRPRRGGFQVLPGLLDRPGRKGGGAAPALEIGQIALRGAAVELYDASVRRPAHRLRLEQLDIRLTPLRVPSLDARSALQVRGLIKGPQQDGRLEIDGWLTPASRESSLHTRLSGVDLKALEPYLLQASETGVRRGSLSMDLRSEVRGQRLRAPGTLRLEQLELAPGGGLRGSFMGVPRSAVIAMLRDRQGRIDLRFTLEGDLSNPQFSLNEDLSRRLAYGLAESLGVSLGGVAQGVGNLGQKGLEAVGDAAQGLGKAVGGLFGAGEDGE